MSVADFHALVESRGRSGKSPAVIDTLQGNSGNIGKRLMRETSQ
jgi:hypothetical protein